MSILSPCQALSDRLQTWTSNLPVYSLTPTCDSDPFLTASLFYCPGYPDLPSGSSRLLSDLQPPPASDHQTSEPRRVTTLSPRRRSITGGHTHSAPWTGTPRRLGKPQSPENP
ncbi:hypothetical protein AALO_G00213300 [Alosa alosa]|uniref:Uncharacterized protein n=1 Tax=Alosa alosa TaxID=278164 RepID=A0AAV6G069_9TELE|nr:hypothetical protein AALO_G00213300 [Alosa alosa]